MMRIEDVAIIGAGPAGLSVALQLKRYGITPLLLEAGEMGGLLKNANLVENYPGFPGGITGSDLVELFKEQAKNTSVAVTKEKVVNLTHDGMLYQVSTEAERYFSRIVVIASGTKPKTLNDLQVPAGLEKKVHYEVYPLLHLRDSHLTIIGAGDAAFDYALNLGKNNRVTILNRGEQIKCLPLLWERAALLPNITYLERTRVIEISESSNHGLRLDCLSPEGKFQLSTDYLIGAIGREAQLDFLPDESLDIFQDLENQGVLYQIGDVCNGIYRQTSIAVGQGVLTAMKIYRCLKERTI